MRDKTTPAAAFCLTLALLLCAACGPWDGSFAYDASPIADGGDTDSDTDSDTDADSDSDTDADADGGSDAGPDAGTDAGAKR